MKRLTKQVKDGYFVLDCSACERKDETCTPMGCLQVATKRLAAYEDAGLVPEYMAHLMDYFRAEREDRLVVLPCKVVCGTTIWWADSNIHEEPIKCEASSFGIYTGPDGGIQLWMNCYVYGPTPMSRSFRMSSIGKTAFLTREEAEAALKEADHA